MQFHVVLMALFAVAASYSALRLARLRRWQQSVRKTYPGPGPHLLFGNLKLITRPDAFNEAFFRNLHEEHGPIVALFFGPRKYALSVHDHRLSAAVHQQCPHRPANTRMILNYLGEGNLLFARGPMVQKLRSAYREMLTGSHHLGRVHQVSSEVFEAGIAGWSGHSVEIHRALSALVYDVTGRVIFQRPWLGTPEGDRIYEIHRELIRTVNQYMMMDLAPEPAQALVAAFWPGFRRYRRLVRELRLECGGVLEAHRSELRSGSEPADQGALTLLANGTFDGEPLFSKDLAVSTLIGFLNSAYDTTLATLTWLCYHLARYPEAQERLREEVLTAFPLGTEITRKEAAALPYLDAVMRESMRLRASVPVNGRVNDDRDVDLGGLTVERGVDVLIPFSLIFRDPEVFENPEEFRPERFLGSDPEAIRARTLASAFGTGKRACSGLQFARVEMRAFLCLAVRSHRLALDPPDHPGGYMLEAGVHQPDGDPPLRILFNSLD